MVWYLAMYMTSFFINSGDIPTSTRRSGSLASHTGMSFAMDTFLLVEVNGVGISFSTAQDLVDKYSISIYVYMAFINLFVFLILGWYLDQVFPNEWGHKRHPLFFLECILKRFHKPEEEKN
jgi:ATP-binding cassette, subfamily A (ABC1), member 3